MKITSVYKVLFTLISITNVMILQAVRWVDVVFWIGRDWVPIGLLVSLNSRCRVETSTLIGGWSLYESQIVSVDVVGSPSVLSLVIADWRLGTAHVVIVYFDHQKFYQKFQNFLVQRLTIRWPKKIYGVWIEKCKKLVLAKWESIKRSIESLLWASSFYTRSGVTTFSPVNVELNRSNFVLAGAIDVIICRLGCFCCQDVS